MSVLMDTSVLSEAFRRRDSVSERARTFARVVQQENVWVIDPVRQELLSGIRERPHFEAIKAKLRAFLGSNPLTEDFETAAEMFNTCRNAGIQGSGNDFLICAMAVRLNLPIFTLDKDFERYAKHLPIRLYAT